MTTIDPKKHSVGTYDAYEYTVHSHQYTTEDIPAARFSYELSPIQVAGVTLHVSIACNALHTARMAVSDRCASLHPQIWVTEKRKPFYHFITTLCAIVVSNQRGCCFGTS